MSICPKSSVCSQYVDGELCRDERINFEKHIQKCSECKDDIKSYERLKNYISCNNKAEIDLEHSFKKLILRHSLKKSFLLYRIFYSWKKNKMFLNASIATFLFTLIFVSVILIQNKMNLKNSDALFKPIIPITYESHLPIRLNSLCFPIVNTNFSPEQRINAETYKNIVNTFNGFTNLYSDLEHSERCTCSNRISIIGRNKILNYSTDIPFYRSLNKK